MEAEEHERIYAMETARREGDHLISLLRRQLPLKGKPWDGRGKEKSEGRRTKSQAEADGRGSFRRVVRLLKTGDGARIASACGLAMTGMDEETIVLLLQRMITE